MSLRTRIVRAMYRASTSLVGPNAWETFGLVSSQAGASGRLNLPGMSRPAENVLWAYAAITARAEAMMQAAVRISNAGGDLVESGPLADLLARPNRWQDGVAFVGAVETCLALYNRAFVAAVSETGALPDELLVLLNI
jgi:phage portal protein BeeE